jgi:hypothetical protein
MTIHDFATKYRLKVRQDKDDGTDIIPGRPGFSHIYEYSDDELGVVFLPYKTVAEPERPRLWNSHARKALDAGMTMRQNGDTEGTFSFNAENQEQAKLAIHIAGIKAKRRVSPEQRARTTEILAAARQRRQAALSGTPL